MVNLDDLPAEAKKHVRKTLGVRVRTSPDKVKKHALAVCSMLMDERELSTKDARKVLAKAISLLK